MAKRKKRLHSSQSGNSPANRPRLHERHNILSLQFGDNSVQSEMNIQEPDRLVTAYTRSMMSFALLNPTPATIAMIGLGGGSLAKYCHRYLPDADITTLEINPQVIALRHEFAIPDDNPRFRIQQQDGAEFIANPRQSPMDVLLVDGFDASGLPNALSTQSFYDNCHARLSEQGILMVNLWTGNKYYPICLQRLQQSFNQQVYVLETSDLSNRVALAIKGEPPTLDSNTLHRQASALANNLPLNWPLKAERLLTALHHAA